ncbi:Peptidase family M48 [Parelusimicrobium proximum]|uniref:M48 family metallopeptidase n=1 Tax=Parelusimicrobium proximum TaxID=3228953 RepID=UPI003D1867ED
MKHSLKILVLLAPLILSACATVGGTGRRQLMLISQSEEVSMGEQSWRQILSQSAVVKNTSQALMVEKVGRKIAAVSGKNYAWEFVLIKDNQVNAFCLPGGKVAVYTGILPVAQDETGLAVIMGHEIAHALARHGAERLSQDNILNFGGQILGMSASTAKFQEAYGLVSTLGFSLPYSRKHETEADDMGLILMAKAGYNPSKAVDFWRRMAALSKSSSPGFLSTHPTDEKRILNLQKQLPVAMSYYYSAGGK